jgi:hypothetical protein
MGHGSDRFAAPRILGVVVRGGLHTSADTSLRKLATKLATRLGLAALRPRLAPWRCVLLALSSELCRIDC